MPYLGRSKMRVRTIFGWMLFLGLTVCAHAQWLNYRAAGTPRTRDGSPNLTAPAPRASNGKPDLSGIWQAEGAPFKELVKYVPGDGVNGVGESDPSLYFFNVLGDFKPEEAPLQPAVAAALRQQAQAAPQNGPSSLCLPTTPLPIADVAPSPIKIVQTPGLVLFLYEADTVFRQIYLDGRKHPDDPQP